MSLTPLQQPPDLLDAPPGLLFKDGEEQVLLGGKMGVERATGMSGGGGDVLNAASLEPITRENPARGLQQGSPGGRGPLLVFVGRRSCHGPPRAFNPPRRCRC